MEGVEVSKVTTLVTYYPKGVHNEMSNMFVPYESVSMIQKSSYKQVYVITFGKSVLFHTLLDADQAQALGAEMKSRFEAYMKMPADNQVLLTEIKRLHVKLAELEAKVDALAYAPGAPNVQEAAQRYKNNEKINITL